MTNVVLLHGTLQRPDCWDAVVKRIESLSSPLNIITPDFYGANPDDLEDWYNQIIEAIPHENKSIVIGYSLGGRFAIELYKRMKREDFGGLVLICMDPGIEDPVEIRETLKRDQIWANKFLEKDWDTLIEEWNNLSVFCGIKPSKIQSEERFSRESLAKLWMLSSKANNPSLWPDLPKISCPVLLISGKLDTKFNLISYKMKDQIPNVEFHEFIECGHRVPWEKPEKFSEMLVDFIRRNY